MAGSSAAFSAVGAGSAPITYQWQRNGVDIPGATSADYGIPVASASDDAAVFTVRVWNDIGGVTSIPVVLWVE
jgi:hypothetical protein